MKTIKQLFASMMLFGLAHCGHVYALELGDLPRITPTVFTARMGDDRLYVAWQSQADPSKWYCYYQETDEFYGVGQKMPVTTAAQLIPPSADKPRPWTLESLLVAASLNSSSKPLPGDGDNVNCNALLDSVKFWYPSMITPVTALSKFVAAHNAAKSTPPDDRPLLDGVTFKQIGTQRVLAGTPCDETEVRNSSGTVYHPTTNAAGIRGVTICALRK